MGSFFEIKHVQEWLKQTRSYNCKEFSQIPKIYECFGEISY